MSHRHPPADVVATWATLLRFVRRATGELDADLRVERGLGLEDYDILFQVSAGPREGVRMTTLAGALLIAPSSCTRLVGRLVDIGWLERRPDPADGRAVVVVLTAAGRRELARASAVHLRGIQRVFAEPLGPEGLAALRSVLDRLGD